MQFFLEIKWVLKQYNGNISYGIEDRMFGMLLLCAQIMLFSL